MTLIQGSLFIITGAASGIGRAVAIQAAAEGAEVLACDIHTAGLTDTTDRIRQAGGQATPFQLDVADKKGILAFAEEVRRAFPNRRMILLNNAGVALASGTITETALDDFEWLLSINLWGVVRMTKAFLPQMLTLGEGHIVNVSSIYGLMGPPQQGAYATAKFGVRGFTDVLRNELKGSGLQVSTVFPGGVKTNIAASARITVAHTTEEKEAVLKKFTDAALTTPEKAAQRILSGIRRNQTRILIGPDARVFDWLTRLMPVRYASIVMPLLERVTGMSR